MGIVGSCELTCVVPIATDAVFSEFALSWGIDGVAEFLGRGSGRGYFKLTAEVGLLYEVLHYVFCHWRAAYITVTYEEDSCHN